MGERGHAQPAGLAYEADDRKVAGAAAEIGDQYRGVAVELARKGKGGADRLVDIAGVLDAETREGGAVTLHGQCLVGHAAGKAHGAADDDSGGAEVETRLGMARQGAQESSQQILEQEFLPRKP